MRVAIWWLLLFDGIFCRASDSPQYYLTRQGRRVVLRRGDVTLPPLERYLTWVPDSAPPPTRYHGDLTSPAPSGNRDNQENTPPQDASRKLLRRLRPRLRRGKQPGSSTNDNSASWKTGTGSRTANRNSALKGTASATRPRSTANDNSAFPEAGSATRPRSMANANSAFPGAGNRPGIGRSMRSTPKEHPWTLLRPQHSQSPEYGPIRIQNADLTRTTLNSGVYINWPSLASSRITTTEFVETPADLASPHLLSSELYNTSSLDRPLGYYTKIV